MASLERALNNIASTFGDLRQRQTEMQLLQRKLQAQKSLERMRQRYQSEQAQAERLHESTLARKERAVTERNISVNEKLARLKRDIYEQNVDEYEDTLEHRKENIVREQRNLRSKRDIALYQSDVQAYGTALGKLVEDPETGEVNYVKNPLTKTVTEKQKVQTGQRPSPRKLGFLKRIGEAVTEKAADVADWAGAHNLAADTRNIIPSHETKPMYGTIPVERTVRTDFAKEAFPEGTPKTLAKQRLEMQKKESKVGRQYTKEQIKSLQQKREINAIKLPHELNQMDANTNLTYTNAALTKKQAQQIEQAINQSDTRFKLEKKSKKWDILDKKQKISQSQKIFNIAVKAKKEGLESKRLDNAMQQFQMKNMKKQQERYKSDELSEEQFSWHDYEAGWVDKSTAGDVFEMEDLPTGETKILGLKSIGVFDSIGQFDKRNKVLDKSLSGLEDYINKITIVPGGRMQRVETTMLNTQLKSLQNLRKDVERRNWVDNKNKRLKEINRLIQLVTIKLKKSATSSLKQNRKQ